jgi:hypothetical protein
MYCIKKVDNISNIGIYKDNITISSNNNNNFNFSNFSNKKKSIKCYNVNNFFDNYNQQFFISIPHSNVFRNN